MSLATQTLSAEALSARLFAAALGAFDIAGVYLGDRLGYYRSLAEDGPATSDELAERTGTDARYAREWLEHQAVNGILQHDGERFVLPDAHRSVLVDAESLHLMAPLARMQAAAFGKLPHLVDAYRSGSGIPWRAYGPDMREGQADFNRPAFANLLGQHWLPAIPDVHRRLQQLGARLADIACGEGFSTLAIARAYPQATVVGVDVDEPSIAAARRHAEEAGLAERVTFVSTDAARLEERFDVAIIIEAVHDMAHPVSVLRSVREALAEGGSLIVVDERVADAFTPNGDEIERFMYGWSILVCLADGRSQARSAATGTVMRPETLRRYAAEAGYASVEVLPLENDFFRFYRLRT